MEKIKAIVLMAVIALSLAGTVKAANASCCASADCSRLLFLCEPIQAL
jgi:hypothetical protein